MDDARAQPAEARLRDDTELQLTLRISIDPEGRPAGAVLAPGQRPVAFAGWLELSSRLSELLEAPDSP